jgi:hypothetical protein
MLRWGILAICEPEGWIGKFRVVVSMFPVRSGGGWGKYVDIALQTGWVLEKQDSFASSSNDCS